MRLLLLEDDLIFGEGLRDYLAGEGYRVEWCTSLAQARAWISEPWDALLLDWNLPDGSGIDWLRTLRARGFTTPAIVLTARDLLADRVQGLDSGADDFVVKPLAVEELAARLRAVARRMAHGTTRTRLGSIEVDLQAKSVWRDGERIELTGHEWLLLEALALRAGRLVSSSDLEMLVTTPGHELASNAIAVHVSKLRGKLGRSAIETVRGLGYRLRLP